MSSRSIPEKESWDTPYRWRDAKSDFRDSTDHQAGKHRDNAFVNLKYHRDPDEPMSVLPEAKDDEKKLCEVGPQRNNYGTNKNNFIPSPCSRYPGTRITSPIVGRDDLKKTDNRSFDKEIKTKAECTSFQSIQLRKTEPPQSNFETFNRNSSPANKDFEYIKAKPVTVKPKYAVDPVSELKSLPRKESSASDDEPPFNFQAILRKTNLRRDSRDSLRNALQAARRFSLTNRRNSIDEIVSNGVTGDEAIESRVVSMELSPGVFIKGHEVEL